MKNKATIVVTAEFQDDKCEVGIGFPSEQEMLDLRATTHVLVSAISLLVRSCSNHNIGIQEHELAKEVIEHFNSEFANIQSFSDSEVHKSYLKDIKK